MNPPDPSFGISLGISVIALLCMNEYATIANPAITAIKPIMNSAGFDTLLNEGKLMDWYEP